MIIAAQSAAHAKLAGSGTDVLPIAEPLPAVRLKFARQTL
jgi:hypothetical protein